MKKNILLIHTGGTISMHLNDQTGAIVPDLKNPLLNNIHLFNNITNVIELEAFHLPSPHITPNEMLTLRNLIMEKAKQHDIHGVVITHGTDTLEETAYFLDLTTQFTFPIVLTGAMRSSNELGADGLYNLNAALRVACHDDARNKGVLVVMHDEIHTSVDVVKASTSSFNTFQSPQYGPIGLTTKKHVHFQHAPLARCYIEVEKIEKRVALLKTYAGMEPNLLDTIIEKGYAGLVLEGFGQGNVPSTIVQGISKLLQHQIPVVVVSRCFKGMVEGIYGYNGGGKTLETLGVIFAPGLNGQKARIKLLVGLNQVNQPMDLKSLFT